MSKKTDKQHPEASANEPISEPLFTDADLAVSSPTEAEKQALERFANKPVSTPYAAAYAGKPAKAGTTSAELLVEVGMKACGDDMNTSSAGMDARRSVLESVAAMILAAR